MLTAFLLCSSKGFFSGKKCSYFPEKTETNFGKYISQKIKETMNKKAFAFDSFPTISFAFVFKKNTFLLFYKKPLFRIILGVLIETQHLISSMLSTLSQGQSERRNYHGLGVNLQLMKSYAKLARPVSYRGHVYICNTWFKHEK